MRLATRAALLAAAHARATGSFSDANYMLMKAHFPARPTLCAADAALVHDLHTISCRHARTRDAERRPGLHGNGRAPGEAGQALPLVVETGLLQTQTPPACAGLSPTLPLHNPTITPFQSVVPRATPARGRGRQEESLRAALLLEQAALCLLRVAPPALRKFSFHMVLAGLRYAGCGQAALGARAYQCAAPRPRPVRPCCCVQCRPRRRAAAWSLWAGGRLLRSVP